MYEIKIPIGIEGEGGVQGLEKFCAHFKCSLQKKKRGEVYWTITSDDPLNFFWLGANINFHPERALLLSSAEKYLSKVEALNK